MKLERRRVILNYSKRYNEFKMNCGRRKKIKLISESFNAQGSMFGVGSSYPRSWCISSMCLVYKYVVIYVC